MNPLLHPVRATALLVALVALALTGCSDDGDDAADLPPTTAAPGGSGTVRQPALEGTITVAAADPLAEAFEEVAEWFREENPGVEVVLRHDAAGALAMQIADGVDTDVFVSSDDDNMAVLVDGDRIDGSPRVMARDTVAIVTAVGNPSGVASLADLADLDRVALCETSAPCGALAAEALDLAGVDLPSATVDEYANVHDTLAAVVAGDADAAVVFTTTATSAEDLVEVVAIGEADNVVTPYPIATLANTGNAIAARAFVDFVLGDDGQRILGDHGFLPPG